MGYLCFPAFLAGFFEIVEPVCLVVGDGFKHYYVFQRISEMVSFSSIISNAEKLRGDQIFNPPTVGKNFLRLSYKNQKMRCFGFLKMQIYFEKSMLNFQNFQLKN